MHLHCTCTSALHCHVPVIAPVLYLHLCYTLSMHLYCTCTSVIPCPCTCTVPATLPCTVLYLSLPRLEATKRYLRKNSSLCIQPDKEGGHVCAPPDPPNTLPDGSRISKGGREAREQEGAWQSRREQGRAGKKTELKEFFLPETGPVLASPPSYPRDMGVLR